MKISNSPLRYSAGLLLAFSLPVIGFSQGNLQKVTVIDQKVEILVPKDLTKMTDQFWNTKYPNRQRPILVLSDGNGEINLLADMTLQELSEKQLSAYKDFRIDHLKQGPSQVKILEDSIINVNERKVGYIKFTSQAIDQNIFNYYFFVIVDGKVLLFTFNCIEKLRAKWEKLADNMVISLKVN
jgi:hypothetical protein